MKNNSKPVTRLDLVDLLVKINASFNASLDKRDKSYTAKFKEIIHRLDRIERNFGHTRIQIRKAGKRLFEA